MCDAVVRQLSCANAVGSKEGAGKCASGDFAGVQLGNVCSHQVGAGTDVALGVYGDFGVNARADDIGVVKYAASSNGQSGAGLDGAVCTSSSNGEIAGYKCAEAGGCG